VPLQVTVASICILLFSATRTTTRLPRGCMTSRLRHASFSDDDKYGGRNPNVLVLHRKGLTHRQSPKAKRGMYIWAKSILESSVFLPQIDPLMEHRGRYFPVTSSIGCHANKQDTERRNHTRVRWAWHRHQNSSPLRVVGNSVNAWIIEKTNVRVCADATSSSTLKPNNWSNPGLVLRQVSSM